MCFNKRHMAVAARSVYLGRSLVSSIAGQAMDEAGIRTRHTLRATPQTAAMRGVVRAPLLASN